MNIGTIGQMVGEQDKCCSETSSGNTLLGNLKRRQVDTQKRLDNLNEAIAALESNPEISKVLELVAKAS